MQFLKHMGILALCAAAHLAPVPARADAARLPAPVVAVVDVQRILQESLAAESVQKQLDAQRERFQSEIEDEENSLRKTEEELARDRAQVPADTYSEREQKLHQRYSTVETHVQERRRALDKAFTDSMNEVRNALLDVVDRAAHEHGANIVIVKQQALWVDKPLDITDEVLRKLNQKLPKVNVVMPPETSLK